VVPAIAGVVFTEDGHVSTIENLFHLLHQLAAIIWLWGIPAVNVLQEWIDRGNDRAAQASLPRQSDPYGPAVIAPAAAVTENPITDTPQ
jgi:putative copper export protein